MKKVVGGIALLVAVAAISFAFAWRPSAEAVQTNDPETIKWYTWEEAIAASEANPKKLFIDVYTDWCGYCKRMDQMTFTDPAVIEFVNANFYPVKFNAEQTGEVVYKGVTMKFVPNGRRGFHELAYSLLDGRLGYPSFVYLDETQDRISISPGYKTPDIMLRELRYIAGNHYQTTRFEDFQSGR